MFATVLDQHIRRIYVYVEMNRTGLWRARQRHPQSNFSGIDGAIDLVVEYRGFNLVRVDLATPPVNPWRARR